MGSEGLTHGGAEGVFFFGVLKGEGSAIFEIGPKDLNSSAFTVTFFVFFFAADLVFAFIAVLAFGFAVDFVFAAALFFFGMAFFIGVFLAAGFFAALFPAWVGTACFGLVFGFDFLAPWTGFFAEAVFFAFALALVLAFLFAVDLIKLSLPIDIPFGSLLGLP